MGPGGFYGSKGSGVAHDRFPGGKAWGLLALSVQSRAKARRLFDVAPGAFRPPPKIVSTVLELERLPSPRAAHLDAFFKIAHAAFGQRRKTVANSLSHGLGMDRAKIEEELKNSNRSLPSGRDVDDRGVRSNITPLGVTVRSSGGKRSGGFPGNVEAQDMVFVGRVAEERRQGDAKVS
jgi:hypothetical protein